MRKEVFVVFGTRPEAIKLAPLIIELKKNKIFKTKIVVTAQHREMLDQVLNLFSIKVDYDLNLMKKDQSLSDLSARILTGLTSLFNKERPDLVIVQGDTTTTFMASLTAYYLKIPVAHVEAGLRSWDKFNPFPEEINRALTTEIADYFFPPTLLAKRNLIKRGIPENKICMSGNTVIDALFYINKKISSNGVSSKFYKKFLNSFNIDLNNGKRNILVTGHRRESFGQGFINICKGIIKIAKNFEDVQIIYPVHLNPNVQLPVKNLLGNQKNIFLIPPVDYESFVFLLKNSYLILTDSGGVQEEAPAFGKPVLVMRNTTERVEGIKSGNCKLVGTDPDKIFIEAKNILISRKLYQKMAKAENPYGDGKASERIVKFLLKNL